MRRSAPLRPSRTALAMTTFQTSVRLLRRNGPAAKAGGRHHLFGHDATVKLPHAARTIARPISRMSTPVEDGWRRNVIAPARSAPPARRTGIVNVNVDPGPTWLLTQTRPPWSSTNLRHRVSP